MNKHVFDRFEHQKRKKTERILQNIGSSYLGVGKHEFLSSVSPLMSLCYLLGSTDSMLFL